MARETKVGLLIGLGMILLIGIIVSDQLAMKSSPELADRQINPQRVDRHPGDALASETGPGSQQGESPVRRSIPNPGALPGPDTSGPQRGGDHPVAFQLDDTAPRQLNRTARQGEPAVADGDATGSPSPPSNGAGRSGNDEEAAIADNANADGRPQEARQSQSDGQRGTLAGARGDQQRVAQNGEQTAQQPGQRAPADQSEQTSTPGPQDQAGQIIHTVESGDTLFQIAKKYYSNGRYWHAIKEANSDKVTANNTVQVGTELVIPDRAGRANRNADSAARSQARLEQVAQAARSRTIEVNEGDTLSGLARAYLGDASKWRAFMRANPDKLDRPEQVRPGMTLRLPELGDQASNDQQSRPQARGSAGQRNAPSPASQQTQRTYTVQPGDTLIEIAEQELGNGAAWKRLLEVNSGTLESPEALQPGMTLTIPLAEDVI
jgi:nucleoid-associated protein YgaU